MAEGLSKLFSSSQSIDVDGPNTRTFSCSGPATVHPPSQLPKPDFSGDDVEQDCSFGSEEGGDEPWDDYPVGASQKRPHIVDPDEDVDIDLTGDQPDLEEYFSNWDIPPKDVVLICRSYASYVASRNKTSRVVTPGAPVKNKRSRS